MCNSSGGGGTTKYEWNEDMRPYWLNEIESGRQLSDQPYQQYPGQRIADINPDQNAAMNAIRHFTDSSGSPVTQAANGQLQQTLDGNYLNGVDQNPWARQINPFQFMGSQTDRNQYAGDSSQTDRNQYAGDSSQFRNVLNTGMEDISNAYQRGTAADTTRMMNMAGVLGGGAHQNAVANNEAGLGRSLGNYAQSMQNTQYDRSSGLEENFLGRDLSARQADRAFRGGLEENYLGRDLQSQQSDLGRAGQLEENRLGRGMGAFENERGRQMGAIAGGQNEQNLALQRYNARLGIGDVQRGFNQDILNQQFNDFQAQQQYPFQMQDWQSGLLSRAQGGMSANSTVNQSGYAASPFSQILGAGLMSYGMMR